MTLELVQGSPDWHAARIGKATASRIADVVAELKNGKGWRAERRNYLAELVIERLTQRPYPHYQTGAMLRGIELEPEARERYEWETGYVVRQVGFVPHPTIADAGASHDGLIDDPIDGLGCIEIKCPELATHLKVLTEDYIDDQYIKQIAWQHACLPDRQWTDFVSFNPDFPSHLQIKIIRVPRDIFLVNFLEREVPIFLAEVAEATEKARVARWMVNMPMSEAA